YSRPMIEGAGLEPRVGGAALGLAEGKTSGAIQGNAGVYFVKVTKKGDVAEMDDPSVLRRSVQTQIRTLIQNSLIPSLVDASDVEDNR
ncbi:hypothetical protein, partial [Klebsiella pneumoniae]|uniref:hypothetical protein n=1 Tax=Klebsiella pneumoniae TaxID=573 RepID=UPI00272EF0B4